MKPLRIALCQITPGNSQEKNVQHALSMIEQAAGNGAALVILPEMFYQPYNLAALSASAGNGETILNRFKLLAKSCSVMICTGSMAYRESSGLLYNRSHLIGMDGEVLLVYDKCHLFDVDLDEIKVKESAYFTAGNTVSTVVTPFGIMGTLICYDIRFPEMAREIALQGAELLIVPAVFNEVTGRAHWHHFMQTRATENQVFIAAVSTGRSADSTNGYKAYGHSMVVSPWGDIIEEAGADECIVYADLSPDILVRTRQKLPLLQHRRGTLYTSFINRNVIH